MANSSSQNSDFAGEVEELLTTLREKKRVETYLRRQKEDIERRRQGTLEQEKIRLLRLAAGVFDSDFRDVLHAHGIYLMPRCSKEKSGVKLGLATDGLHHAGRNQPFAAFRIAVEVGDDLTPRRLVAGDGEPVEIPSDREAEVEVIRELFRQLALLAIEDGFRSELFA